MGANLPRRLSLEDAGFLYLEKPTAPLHVGSLGIYEGTIPFDALVSHMESRMHTIPRYRQRVTFVPLNLGHPTWEDDPNFDIRRHIRRIRPRGRVDDARLAEIAAKTFAPGMDRTKPLWDITLIEGLTEGRSALVARAHHCMVDGVSGVELLVALLDLTPEPREVEPPTEQWVPQPAPAPADMMSDAVWDWLYQQVGTWSDLQLMLLDPQEGRRRLGIMARSFQKVARFFLTPVPPTSFNAPVSPQRALAWTEMPFADLRAIRGALGGTVNDVVLAILAGGLARYIGSHSVDGVASELRVLIPVNVRRENEQGSLGNRVSFMVAGLPLGMPDPIQRFSAIRMQVQELKDAKQAEGLDMVAQLLGQVPPPLAPAAASTLATFPFTLSNLVCTNVPGPMVPVYCVGHRMLAHYPLAPLSFDLGVNVGVMSYDQRMFWGLMANAATMPDPDRLARNLDEAFLELRGLAGVAPIELPPIGERVARDEPTPLHAVEQVPDTVARRRNGRRPTAEEAPVSRRSRSARRL